jgi:hypothetical protein
MRLLTGAAIALLASTAAFAQPMGGHGGQGGDRPMMGMMGGGPCMMIKRTEGALAFLKTELKITPAQEKAWGSFATAFRAASADKAGHGGHKGHGAKHGKGEAATFPDKVAHHAAMMDSHHAGFKTLSDAAKPLYDGLSAEQRKTADDLLIHFVMSHHCGMM